MCLPVFTAIVSECLAPGGCCEFTGFRGGEFACGAGPAGDGVPDDEHDPEGRHDDVHDQQQAGVVRGVVVLGDHLVDVAARCSVSEDRDSQDNRELAGQVCSLAVDDDRCDAEAEAGEGELDRADAVVLSPPGFGVPAPRGFDSSTTTYRDWLASQLELFRAPVDLVGHDWGGIHVAALAMSRPDLIRSWASDALGVFAPDYVWHPRAQVWQQEGPGEASVQELWGGDLEQRLAVTSALGTDRTHGPAGRGSHGSQDGSRRPQTVAVGTPARDGRSRTAATERRTTSGTRSHRR